MTEVNTELEDNAALVNESPMIKGWFFKMRLSDPKELEGLMDESAYEAYVEGLD